MKTIPLTKGMEAIVDDDFSLHGVKWYASKSTATHYYAKGIVDGRQQLLHRVLMDAPKGQMVDHINGNTLDNRKCNLRIATPSQNASNRTKSSNKTGHMYVSLSSGGRFAASLTVQGKKVYVGCFDTAEEAESAARRVRKYDTQFAVGRFWNETVESALRRELAEIEQARAAA